MMRLSDCRTVLAAALLLLAAGALASCGGGGGGGPAASQAAAQGESLYQKTCATCHGADGHGMPKLGKDLHNNEFTQKLSDDELVEFLLKGRPAWDPLNERGVDMPPKGGNPTLTEQDLRQIVAFLRTLQ